MPALKKVLLPTGFLSLKDERNALNENRDCTVVAMTLTTGLPYAVCHKALAEQGRKHRRGTFFHQQEAAYESLGFKLRQWTSREVVDMIMSYPKKGIHGITTHQPRRFRKQWARVADRRILLYSTGHVSALIDGNVEDWAINRAKRVYMIVEVTKA